MGGGGGVKGRLEIFRKFILFGMDRLPQDIAILTVRNDPILHPNCTLYFTLVEPILDIVRL